MTNYDTIKTLGIFFAPIIIPRLISYYRSIRTSLSRPSYPRPLPPLASRALNLLFCSTALFLILSLPVDNIFNASGRGGKATNNVFKLTSSRLDTPTGVIFSRLAHHRPTNTLTEKDTILQSKLTSFKGRHLYLRFGAEPLISCDFCSFDNPFTYFLFYLPFNTLLPHLFHLLITGLATSAPLAGKTVGKWRSKIMLGSIILFLAELGLTIHWTMSIASKKLSSHDIDAGPPHSFYARMATLRPLVFTLFDALCAAVIYLSSTNRLFFTPPTNAEQTDHILSLTTSTLGSAMSKIHALNVSRNVLIHDKELKDRYDAYYEASEERDAEDWVWKEEEVVKAMSKAMRAKNKGSRSAVDNADADNPGTALADVNVDAYVDGITAGLEVRRD